MVKKSLCEHCKGLCCRYFALEIDTPEDRDDFEDIRWYLCHENVSVFVEEDKWYVSINNKCHHLSEEDYKCKIYNKRPKICRGYKADGCDFDSGEYDYELHFKTDAEMEEYIKIKFDNNKIDKKKLKRNSKKRKK